MDPFRQFLFDFCCFEIVPHTEAQDSWNYVAQAVFKIMIILLPQLSKCWDNTENIEATMPGFPFRFLLVLCIHGHKHIH